MKKKLSLTLLVLFIIFGLIFGWYGVRQYFMKKYFATFSPPPQVVSVAVAQSQNWQPFLQYIGNLTAVSGVDISSEVSGQVKFIYFQSGQNVEKGQALIQLDDSTEKAQLKDISAQLQLAEVNYKRALQLFKQGANSQSNVDDNKAKFKQLQANFENIESIIAKKLIKAPFQGKIGIKQINIGQYISPGFACVSLQFSKTLNAQFSLPQQDTSKVFLNQDVEVTTDAFPGQIFKGIITAIDSKVDENTRTIKVQATIENDDKKLLPGMYVNGNIMLPVIPKTITLPQTAITYTLYGDSAFIVQKSNEKGPNGEEIGSVKRVLVKTGEKRNNTVVILEGIKAGDIVVNSGQVKLIDGAKISINNSNQL